jgi:hypothetical protein
MADTAKAPSGEQAPTREVGAPADIGTPIAGLGSVLPWSTFIDERETAPDLTWPKSSDTYRRMQADAQVKGLLLATTLPIRRYRWELDPNGAKASVTKHVAASLNLPIRGEDQTTIRQRGRFNHDRHLAHALQALGYGHYYFEQVYEIGDDGLVHLKKLGTRPPRTISNFVLEDNGALRAIQQQVLGAPSSNGNGSALGVETLTGRTLGIERLLGYIWEPEDDADWVGRSMLRSCHPNWAIKDRLLRLDATKHERNSMGIPWFEVEDGNDKQVAELAKIAAEIRAGEYVGGAGQGRLRIAGVEGILPDTIGSVRYHDEQMSKAFLLLFFNLGTTETGSRALGSEFIDWYAQAQTAIADWYAATTQAYQIEDEVELNWGPDETPPRLTYTRVEDAALSIADLKTAVESGLIAATPELRVLLADRFGVPRPPEPEDETPAPPSGEPGGDSAEGEPTPEGAPEPGMPPLDPNAEGVPVREHERSPPTAPPKVQAATAQSAGRSRRG